VKMADIRIGILALLAGVATLASAINTVLCNTTEAFLTFFAGLGFFLVLMRTWKAAKKVECD